MTPPQTRRPAGWRVTRPAATVVPDAPYEGGRVETLLQTLAGLDGWVVHAVLALLVLGESAAVVALFLPGELALLAAGALAAAGVVSLPVVALVAVLAAVAGHAVSYELGRRHGLRLLRHPLLRHPLLRRTAGPADAAVALVARYGAAAVLLGRWTNVGRVLVPLLAGAAGVRRRTFTLYNMLGGTGWALSFVLLGSAAGATLPAVERTLGRLSWAVTGVVVVVLLGGWVWRRTRRGRGTAAAGRRGDGAAGTRRPAADAVHATRAGGDG